MVKTYAVVPYKNEGEMTSAFLNQLFWAFPIPMGTILLYDNGSRPEERAKVQRTLNGWFDGWIVEHFDAADKGIYEMWNDGWKYAEAHTAGDFNVLFLNNDITFDENLVMALAHALRNEPTAGIVYPNYDMSAKDGWDGKYQLRETRGTYKDGGMCGWCFMVRGEELRNGVPLIDEQFQWWYGDDLMELNFREAGWKVYRLEGLPVDHVNEATSRNGENEWTHFAKQEDMQYWQAKYGNGYRR